MSKESSTPKSQANRLGRRKFLKQSAFAIAGTTSLAAFLAACGDNTPTTAAPVATTAAPAAATTAAATSAATTAVTGTTAAGAAPTGQTLTIWHNSASPKPYIDLFQRWATKTGNKINLVAIPADGYETTTTTKWAAGERPDLMEYHATSLFLALNPSQNLQDLSGEDFVKKAGSLYPAYATQNGKIYGAVTVFPTLFGLFYNKQVLAQAGLQPPQNFTDLKNAYTTLKQKSPNIVPIFENGGSSWPTQILPAMYLNDWQKDDAFGQSVISKKATMDDPNGPFVEALTTYQNFLKDGAFNKDITTGKFEDAIKAVAEGKAAMTALHSGVVPLFNAAFGDDPSKTDSTIGFAYPSKTKAILTGQPGPTGTYYAPKTGNAAKEAAALDFIRYATGEGYQQTTDESKSFPVLSGFKDPSGVQGLNLETKKAYDTGLVPAFNTNLVGFNAQFDKLMGTIISGQATPQAAAKQAQLQLAQGAKAQKLPGW